MVDDPTALLILVVAETVLIVVVVLAPNRWAIEFTSPLKKFEIDPNISKTATLWIEEADAIVESITIERSKTRIFNRILLG